jgi:hypothetical protein
MPSKKKMRTKQNAPAQTRVLNGVDSKHFRLNDYVPVTIPAIENSVRYTITI